MKKIKEKFCAQTSKKISTVIKKVSRFEVTLTHKAGRPSIIFSNSFTHYQAEQAKKGVICVQILIEIHQTEHNRVHFLGGTTSFIHLFSLLCYNFRNASPPHFSRTYPWQQYGVPCVHPSPVLIARCAVMPLS